MIEPIQTESIGWSPLGRLLKRVKLPKNWREMPDDEWDLILKEQASLNTQNAKVIQQHKEALTKAKIDLLTVAKIILGSNSVTLKKVMKSMDLIQIESKNSEPLRFNAEERNKDKQAKAKLAREEEQKIAQTNLIQEAIIFLQERNQVLGKDFTLEKAVMKANKIRYNELVKEKLDSDEGPWECDGCEECGTWDGCEGRCECGNRRVYWESYGDFTDMRIYPESY